MKIGILGTRGIPNHYGGFEQWAELLSVGLVDRGCEVFVYNSHNHPYQDSTWNNVNIVHCYDPEYLIGTAGQFIYDLNCILDCRKRNFDVILQLGYTSSSVWGWLLPQKIPVITNMDGLEWKRDKFSRIVQHFLVNAEKLAVKYSDHLIADSPVIEDYYNGNYNKSVNYIPYGTTIFKDEDESKITNFNVEPFQYMLLIARLEPENNIETIIKGVLESNSSKPLLIIGNYKIPHGKYLFNKYQSKKKISFLGAIYDKEILNNLRFFSSLYFHGHSVGGTNPSLLEAMACSADICAHENPYNKSVLRDNGLYFNSSDDIAELINKGLESRSEYRIKNSRYIKEDFLLQDIIDKYYKLLKDYKNKVNIQ